MLHHVWMVLVGIHGKLPIEIQSQDYPRRKDSLKKSLNFGRNPGTVYEKKPRKNPGGVPVETL